MILGTVVGTVVAEKRADRIEGAKYLLIDQCRQDGSGKNNFLVALDMVGAGNGEMVLLSQGSASRQTALTDNTPTDAIVAGIVDCIDEGGMVTYEK